MSERRAFTLDLAAGRTLHGTVDLPAEPGPRPTVVVCHGFKGFHTWGFFPPLAELLAARGFTVIRFDFHGSGMRPGDELVTDLEAFRTATVGRDLEDLAAVLGAAGGEIAGGRVDRDRVGLLGFSRGGGVALLAAADAASRPRPRALVTWSAIGSFDRVTGDERRTWLENGELLVRNTRTGQELAVGAEVLRDLEARRDDYDLSAAARRRTVPWLLVHGTADETVPVDEAHGLHEVAREPRRLLLIGGGSHTYQARHPFAGPTPPLIEAMNATQKWFRDQLG